MPYKSDKQRRFFNWAAKTGKDGITKKMAKSWNKKTKGKKLPESKSSKKD